LGKHEFTDILVVSFSSNDYVAHEYGPESPEAHEISIQTDRLLDKLLAVIDRQVGASNALFVLSADHGGAPPPQANASRKMPGGRIPPAAIRDAVQNALVKKYGPGDWISGHWDTSIYLNRKLIEEKKLQRVEVAKEAAHALESLPHVFRVYTMDGLMR